MGIIKRQSIKATIVTYIGIVVAYINVLYLWPLCLSTEQVGLLRLLPDIALIVAIFVRLGTNFSAIRFFQRFNNPDKGHNGLLFNMLFIPTVMFCVFCVAYLLFRDTLFANYLEKDPLLDQYLFWLLPITLFSVYNTNLEVYANLHLRIVVPTLIREVLWRIAMMAVVLLFYWQLFSFDALIALYAGLFGLMTLALLAYISRLKKLFLRPNWAFLNKSFRKEIAGYTALIIVGGVGSIIATKIDTVMVTLYAPNHLSDTGIFSTAALIAMVIEMPKRSINQIATPIVTEHLEKNNTHALDILYKRSADTQFLAGLFLFLGVWLNIDSMFAIMPNGTAYESGKMVIFYIGLSKLFDMVTSINSLIVTNSKYYRFALYGTLLLAALGIGLNLIFIPLMGIEGAALATAISILLYNVFLVWLPYSKMGIHPFSIKTAKIVLCGLVVFALVTWLPQFANPYVDILFRGTLITVSFGGLAYFMRISEDVNTLVNKGLQWIGIKGR